METNLRGTHASSASALEQKYWDWKQKFLIVDPQGSGFSLVKLLEALGDKRLIEATDEAHIGLFAEKLINAPRHKANFRFAVGICLWVLNERGIKYGQRQP